MRILLCTLLLSITATSIFAQAAAESAAKEKGKAKRRVNPIVEMANPKTVDANLPRVLIIGDSISIGYTVAVRELLAGKANVFRPPANCGPTTNGVKNIDAWLGTEKWDVIHFNWGLHDIKFVTDDPNKIVPVETAGAKWQVNPEEYEKNLRLLVDRMKKTGAKLIWCTTTPVVPGSTGRRTEDVLKFNEVAGKVMQENGVATDDLYAFALPRLKDIQLPVNVHYSPEGSKVLAQQVAASIEAALKK